MNEGNPQIENGHTKIANELLEALVRVNLSGCEFRLVLHVIRKTYGYHKKEDWISYTKFQKALGVGPSTIFRTINSLLARRVVLAYKQVGKTVYGLNKHYSDWVLAPTQALAPRKQTTCVAEIQALAPTQVTKESLTKEILQKKKETVKENAAAIFYENNFGLLSQYLCEELLSMEEAHGEQNLLRALKIAVEAGKRNIRYVRGILENERGNGYTWEKVTLAKRNPIFNGLRPGQVREVEMMMEQYRRNLGEEPKESNIRIMIKKVSNGEIK